MSAEATTRPGLRERKKRRTRELIAETARRLFTERGFEAVTVAEIADAAEVSEKTVFNYFPTKEDLVYWRLETFEEELLATIRDRDEGESIVTAFARFVLRRRGLLAEPDPEPAERLVGLTRMIVSSPALLAREREVYDRYTASLAALIADEVGARARRRRALGLANALMGVHRALVDYARRGIVAGARGPRLAREARAQGRRALRPLERGLEGYGANG